MKEQFWIYGLQVLFFVAIEIYVIYKDKKNGKYEDNKVIHILRLFVLAIFMCLFALAIYKPTIFGFLLQAEKVMEVLVLLLIINSLIIRIAEAIACKIPEERNKILAMVAIDGVILVGWVYFFFIKPTLPKPNYYQ